MDTAAIVMRLHERNQPALEAPIARYLPASLIQGIRVLQGTHYSEGITLSQLISHTSGLADYESDRTRGGRSVLEGLIAGLDRSVSTAEAIEVTRGLVPPIPPGTPGRAHDSNTNDRLLGAVIEIVSEKSMAANFEEEIFSPLGMSRSYLDDEANPCPGLPPATIDLEAAPAIVPRYLAPKPSAGSLVSTAAEGITFLRAFFEGRLFDPSLLERMMD